MCSSRGEGSPPFFVEAKDPKDRKEKRGNVPAGTLLVIVARFCRCCCSCAECLQQHSKLLQVNRLQSARRIAALIKRQQWQLFSVGNIFAMHSLSRCCLLQPLQQHSPSSITCHPGCHRVPLQKHATNFPKLLQN
jgi:hypothetical protein